MMFPRRPKLRWLLAPLVVVVIFAYRRHFVVATVDGLSMSPMLQPGDRLLVLTRQCMQIRREALVLVDPPPLPRWGDLAPTGSFPRQKWMVKRVAAIPGDPRPATFPTSVAAFADTQRVPPAHYYVLGMHPQSLDSRTWGYVSAHQIVGRVITRLPARP